MGPRCGYRRLILRKETARELCPSPSPSYRLSIHFDTCGISTRSHPSCFHGGACDETEGVVALEIALRDGAVPMGNTGGHG